MLLDQQRTSCEFGVGETLRIVELGLLPPGATAAAATTMYKQTPQQVISLIYWEGSAIFKDLQQKKLSGVLRQGSLEWSSAVNQYSKDMQEMLRRNLEKYEKQQNEGGSDEVDSGTALGTSVDSVILGLGVWGVIHTCFVEKGRQLGHMTQDLLKLLHQNSSLFGIQKVLDLADYLEAQEGRIEMQEQYWQIILQLLANGYFKRAVELLGEHSIWQRCSEDEKLIEEEWATLLDLMDAAKGDAIAVAEAAASATAFVTAVAEALAAASAECKNGQGFSGASTTTTAVEVPAPVDFTDATTNAVVSAANQGQAEVGVNTALANVFGNDVPPLAPGSIPPGFNTIKTTDLLEIIRARLGLS
eukprot:TRINITY_DN4704_c0_g1_i6.p1 TRINITY_DN4704_c0_g1~~TRINITY_DN4704_c0_g1_i6.p1  ORF type:complete len:359 (-),score=75.14 TRINITY_DN4704_c0_g1_i6:1279-2355(-)